MRKPIYPNEKTLFLIASVIAALIWAAVIYKTHGLILILIPVFFVAYLFVQSGLISYLKGTGALVSDAQFSDIQQRTKACAEKIQLRAKPIVYILHGNGIFNAFATRFLRKDYIILLSDVLDALEDHPDAINFYIGHEMGHIDRKHLLWEPFLSVALVLPLLGAAYSRSREYTCDLYGAACCLSPQAAQQGIALLAVGGKRYKVINMQEYMNQSRETSGFWMSFHELIASYPWLVKRLARISPGGKEKIPSRNPLAYIPAVFVPRLNILSLVIIYVLVIALASEGIVKSAMGETVDGAVEEEAMSEAEPLSGPELLSAIADQINAGGLQQLDEITTMQGAHIEDGALVHNYVIKEEPGTIDAAIWAQSMHEQTVNYWCADPEAQAIRDSKLRIIYRSTYPDGSSLGEAVVDTAQCP